MSRKTPHRERNRPIPRAGSLSRCCASRLTALVLPGILLSALQAWLPAGAGLRAPILGPLRAHAQESAREAPQILTVAEEALPDSLNPLNVSNLVERRSIELVHDGLFRSDERGRPAPSLIEVGLGGHPIFRKVGPEDVYEGRLGLARFHDGRQASVRDLELSLQALASPSSPRTTVHYRDLVREVRPLRNPEDRDFRLSFARGMESPESSLTFKLLPHQAFSVPDDPSTWTSDERYERQPVGAGPFMVREAASGRLSWLLEAFPDYHRGRPRLDGIRLVSYPAITEQLNALLAGQVHVLVSLNKHEQSRARMVYQATTVPYHVRNWWYLGFNCRRLPDLNIRQGLARVVDRAALARQLAPEVLEANRSVQLERPTGGQGRLHQEPSVVLLTGPFVPESPYYNRHVPQPVASPGEAARLLRLGRWEQSRRTQEWQRDGRPVELRLAVRRDLPSYENILATLRQQFLASGIRLQTQVLDNAGWEQQVVEAGRHGQLEFDLVLGRWNVDQSDDVTPIFQTGGPLNFLGYGHPESDRLLEGLRTEKDPDRRITDMHRLHSHLAEQTPCLFLWEADQVAAFHRRVGGYQIHSFAFYVHPQNWYLKPEVRQ